MSPYNAPDPSLNNEYEELVATLQAAPADERLMLAANALALKIRSRCIDLATWKVDYGPEYSLRIQQCKTLTSYAGVYAHEFLIREFRNT
jgi:hypothetical protein